MASLEYIPERSISTLDRSQKSDTQQSVPHSLPSKQLDNNALLNLPEELLEHILSFLDPPDPCPTEQIRFDFTKTSRDCRARGRQSDLLPLLHTCKTFRERLLKRFYKSLEFTFDLGELYPDEKPVDWHRVEMPSDSVDFTLVKRVCIIMPAEDSLRALEVVLRNLDWGQGLDYLSIGLYAAEFTECFDPLYVEALEKLWERVEVPSCVHFIFSPDGDCASSRQELVDDELAFTFGRRWQYGLRSEQY